VTLAPSEQAVRKLLFAAPATADALAGLVGGKPLAGLAVISAEVMEAGQETLDKDKTR
jgi:hypothetical protein